MSGGLPFAGIATFLGWPASDGAPPAAPGGRQLVAIGAPYDEGTPYRPGSRLAPAALRQASMRLRFASADGLGFFDVERRREVVLADLAWDAGDVEIWPGDQAASFAAIEAAVGAARAVGAIPVLLGGDNSVTLPSLRGLGAPAAVVVQFDAHLDYGESYFGSPDGNSTPLRRSRREGLCAQVLHLGIRGYDNAAAALADSEADGNVVVTAAGCRRGEALAAIEALAPGTAVYVSLDIDVVDPALAPGTGYPEPGGLDYPLLRSLLLAVGERCELLGCELVEVSPPYDADGVTALLGTQLLIDLLAAAAPPGPNQEVR
ncbi:MAG: arginase family protein [Solirubrobacterales bacterium]